MNRQYRRKGSAIAFGAVLALVLVVLGLGFLAMSMYLGGENETKNAVDAGALNIGRQVIDDKNNIGFQLNQTPDQQCFLDSTTDSSDGKNAPDNWVTLRRINRIWGEAILINLNAQATKSSKMVDNASSASAAAQAISDKLHDRLTAPGVLDKFFTDFATKNSVRMLGNGAGVTVVPGSNWNFSRMEVDHESNIQLNGSPPNFNLPVNISNSIYTKSLRTPIPPGGENLYFLKGYHPFQIGDQTLWSVPFGYDEKPHLVSQTTFVGTGTDTMGWDKAVPNGFSVEGKAEKVGSIGETAISRVLTNPRQAYQISIPHGFVHIHVDDQFSHWWFFPAGFPVDSGFTQEYGYRTDDEFGMPMPFGGIGCSTVTPNEVTVGAEVAGASVDSLIFNYPFGDVSSVEKVLLQRVNELVSVPGKTLTANELHQCLQSGDCQLALQGSSRDFYIFSNDGGQTILCEPKEAAILKAPWLLNLIGNGTDGEKQGLITQDNNPDCTAPAAFFDVPVATPSAPTLVQSPPPGSMEIGTCTKEFYWTPSSGYNSNLGELEIKRWTDVYNLAICL